MLSNLLMAVLSSMVPGFGLFGSIVKYISSDDPESGKTFLIDLATSTLPGGFLTDFGVSIATDVFLGNQTNSAVNQVIPPSKIEIRCNGCGRITNRYVRREGRYICNSCLSREISNRVSSSDKIYIAKKNVISVQNEIRKQNSFLNRYISNDSLGNRKI